MIWARKQLGEFPLWTKIDKLGAILSKDSDFRATHGGNMPHSPNEICLVSSDNSRSEGVNNY